MTARHGVRFAALFCLASLLSGCDMLGIETPAQQAAAAQAEGKAIGSACRHAGRAIEDCFALNPQANKSAVFSGWKDMNDYMTKNKIEVVTPQVVRAERSNARGTRGTKSESDADLAESESRAAPADDPDAKPARPQEKSRATTDRGQAAHT